MATLRPTLQQIIDRVHNDTVARLDEESLRRSDIAVFERVIAGASHALYSVLEFGRNQLFSTTAQTGYLEQLGTIFGISRKQAVKASGQVTFTYANGWVDVPVGTILQNGENLYTTITAPNQDGVATIQANVAGTAYNLNENTVLTMSSAITGVNNEVTCTTAIANGTDEETDDSLRVRVLERTQNPPRQGTKEDYIAWCKEVEGCGNAWCFPKEYGDGTVTMRIVDDDMEIPEQDLVDKVQAHVQDKSNIMATVYTEKPIAQPINFTLKITPDNTTLRANAETAIKNLFKKESVPGGKIYLSHINAVISSLNTEEDHTIVSPSADIQATDNAHLATVGTITWI